MSYISEKTKKIIEGLPEEVKEAVYRLRLTEYTVNDMVKKYSEEFGGEITSETMGRIEAAAEAYAFNGDYDGNFGYWDNINFLMEEYGVFD